MPALTPTLRIHRPYAHVYAFYEGRVDGGHVWQREPNWLELAYSLGVCSYAVTSGDEALLYDTGISLAHAQFMRKTLEDQGARRIRVVLSHWHIDHVAGNEVFADCEIIANPLTAQALRDNRARFESREPRIQPLVMPNSIFEGRLSLKVGDIEVELRQLDIHSHDCTVLIIPQLKLLVAGDAMEEPISWVAEPKRLDTHLLDLKRMADWDIIRILPSHGDEKVIATGGYGPELIAATCNYVEKLLLLPTQPELAKEDLRTFIAKEFEKGSIVYYPPYERVHVGNVNAVLGRPRSP